MKVADSDQHKGEVLFYNPGGPGVAAQSFIWAPFSHSIFHGLQDMDIVGKAWWHVLSSERPDPKLSWTPIVLDVRGTGQSSPVNCSSELSNAIDDSTPGTYPQTEVGGDRCFGQSLNG
jgi:hypothetical protein